ncbi:hypothetical protein Cob_v004461 [Colletotrichum orbiculare MAFF 240422]|uniref:Reverse transcriptase domain-containing protein n=1 Tax=Colletotrichum orbiculare (strain 104-T / ATCC 96160 / CBS 514.97 / LARS 414 / MAFF 240422) TaxID=1213857 RepID=A0A484FZC0_COLOR|nr:hypothetical protein Cob_v004461 [Colletotrichum orbiculare MAFF 240422]
MTCATAHYSISFSVTEPEIRHMPSIEPRLYRMNKSSYGSYLSYLSFLSHLWLPSPPYKPMLAPGQNITYHKAITNINAIRLSIRQSQFVSFTTQIGKMAAPDVLSQTLYTITSVKLNQLDKQKEAYESSKKELLHGAEKETDLRKRVKLMLDTAKKLPTVQPLHNSHMANLKRFVQQAEFDPCVSSDFLNEYEASVRRALDIQSAKYSYAELYGKLVNEWISAGKASSQNPESGFVPVGREEMHQQRRTWEDYVFTAKDTDGDAIKDYLEELFRGSKDTRRAFKDLKKGIKRVQKSWDDATHFDKDSLTDTIRALLRTNVLSNRKRTVLNDFLHNPVVLSEIADVLNMRMQTRKSWAWDEASIVDQQRQLNGRYRFYPDEDLLHAIFIHRIGMKWSVEMRGLLVDFFAMQGVEKDASSPMTKQEARRRRYFLRQTSSARKLEDDASVERTLASHFKTEVFLDQMPHSMTENRGSYGADESEADDDRKTHVEVVQNLLHMIQSEIILHQKLGQDVTVIRSDFKWFGPSVPHSSIFAVLDFFGVDAEWIDLFRRILECPLRFAQDPPDTPAQTRKRGTPLSTPLADFFAETMLFCMDLAVNQRGDGARLYRLHDDMWLWGGLETCARAWETMTKFAKVTGLDFNEDKTGSATIVPHGAAAAAAAKKTDDQLADVLPKGDIVWGFLKLDAATGRFHL